MPTCSQPGTLCKPHLLSRQLQHKVNNSLTINKECHRTQEDHQIQLEVPPEGEGLDHRVHLDHREAEEAHRVHLDHRETEEAHRGRQARREDHLAHQDLDHQVIQVIQPTQVTLCTQGFQVFQVTQVSQVFRGQADLARSRMKRRETEAVR